MRKSVDSGGSGKPCSGWARGAFTLLELLTVLAIFTMLIAILIPSLRAARMQTKRVLCASNLRQLASAWPMYLDAHGGRFLKGINTNWNYGGKQGNGSAAFGSIPINPANPDVLSPPVVKPLNLYLNLDEVVYLGAEIFRCPADEGGGDVPTTHYDYKGTSYTTNLMLVGQDRLQLRLFDPCRAVFKEVNKLLPTIAWHQLHGPGKLILMGDAGWLSTWDLGNFNRIAWHGKRTTHNVAFMDGHVEFVRIRKGLHVTSEYSVIPFKDLIYDVEACQKEVAGE